MLNLTSVQFKKIQISQSQKDALQQQVASLGVTVVIAVATYTIASLADKATAVKLDISDLHQPTNN
jgi:hypothetical protein